MIFLEANLQRIRDELVIQRTKSAEFLRVFELSVFRDPLDEFECCEMEKPNHEKPKVRKHEKETHLVRPIRSRCTSVVSMGLCRLRLMPFSARRR